MSFSSGGAAFRPLRARVAFGVAAAWGAAEASVFFIVPDVWIGLVALRHPRRAMPAVASAVAGALVGVGALHSVARRNGGAVDALIARLPGIRPSDVAHVRDALAARGLRAFLDGPLRALPVKLYVREAQRAGIPLRRVLAGAALNRLVRLVPVAATFALLGRIGHRVVERRFGAVAATYAAGWALFYVVYWRSRR